MLLALHMTHSRMAPVKEKVKNSPCTSMWVTCLWSGQTFCRASQAADTYAGVWGILNFFLHSTPIHFYLLAGWCTCAITSGATSWLHLAWCKGAPRAIGAKNFFLHRWHLGCDVAFQCPWSWLDACRRPNGTVLQLWMPVSFFLHRGFPATSLQKFMDLSHSSILQAYDIMYYSGAQSHFNQWANRARTRDTQLVAFHLSWGCNVIGCVSRFWLGGLIDWNVTAGFPRFLALLRCFCQQLTWSDTSEPLGSGSEVSAQLSWGFQWYDETLFRMTCFQWYDGQCTFQTEVGFYFESYLKSLTTEGMTRSNDMMDIVLSKLRLVSTLNHTWSLWLQRAWWHCRLITRERLQCICSHS